MRDEVLIEPLLVAMVTLMLANKRVGKNCVLADRGRKRRAERGPGPEQSG